MSPLVALNRRADRPLSCPVLGVFLPLEPVTAKVAIDPKLHIEERGFDGLI